MVITFGKIKCLAHAAFKQPKIQREIRTIQDYGVMKVNNIYNNRATTKYFEPIVDGTEPSFERTYCISSDKYVPSIYTFTGDINSALKSSFVSNAMTNCPDELKLGTFLTGCEADLEFAGMPEKTTVDACVESACVAIYDGSR